MAQNIKDSQAKNKVSGMVFGKINYQLMIASIIVILIGFILMSGTTDIYSFTKITLAPIVVIAGFALGFVAILKKPKRD
ncbi:DUF3098 domain-containing protein [Albibacterium profundi]|uniref:DUF3098 domain-containing protein n=1 Tax=Albibacterium profundi TaxID=3134906 RepID=A0ABV5CED9_9SPHI